MLNLPADLSPEERALRVRFTLRFQQTTGPVQAKGLEDTTFYRQMPLVSLNEVGGDPSRFGNSPTAFHSLNSHRLCDWPGGLSTTATHDTKRGEDGRIRINVISELSEDWKTRLPRWSRWNARKKTTVNETECPDPREEYLLYQTLIGAWPFGAPDDGPPAGFVERVQGFFVKAACEAKRNTTWTDPDPTYKETLSRYVAGILEGADASPFLNDFLVFQRRVARIGVVHSLSQALLKLASPGTADVYQGCELWDFSMVDPDNRRPVDFEARVQHLARIRSSRRRLELVRELYAAPEDGAIKLLVVSTVLNHRRDHPDLYLRGAYRPVEVSGEQKDRVVAFLRSHQGQNVIAVGSRLVAPLMGDDATRAPLGPDVWGETELLLSESTPSRWHNILTGERVATTLTNAHRGLRLAEVFRDLPLALLVEEPSAD
jgi:(1->4)-alpha-D-glucan 1-alpha-D-glucosylmutase